MDHGEQGAPTEHDPGGVSWASHFRHARIPDFVLLEASSRAVHLFGLLALHADREGECWPGRKGLAATMDVTVRSLDGYMRELVDLGAVSIKTRWRTDGGQTSNRYLLHADRHGAARGSEPDFPPAGEAHFAPPEKSTSPQELEPREQEPVEQEKTRRLPQAEADVPPDTTSVAASPPEQGSLALDDDEIVEGEIVEEGGFQPTVVENLLDRKGQAAANKADRQSAIARRVFEAWVEASGTNPKRAKLNAKRREKIYARLNEGYTEEDLCAAVRGVMLSPFHMGDNSEGTRYTDITISLRDGDQVEKFRGFYERGSATQGRKTDVVDRVFARIASGERLL